MLLGKRDGEEWWGWRGVGVDLPTVDGVGARLQVDGRREVGRGGFKEGKSGERKW